MSGLIQKFFPNLPSVFPDDGETSTQAESMHEAPPEQEYVGYRDSLGTDEAEPSTIEDLLSSADSSSAILASIKQGVVVYGDAVNVREAGTRQGRSFLSFDSDDGEVVLFLPEGLRI